MKYHQSETNVKGNYKLIANQYTGHIKLGTFFPPEVNRASKSDDLVYGMIKCSLSLLTLAKLIEDL